MRQILFQKSKAQKPLKSKRMHRVLDKVKTLNKIEDKIVELELIYKEKGPKSHLDRIHLDCVESQAFFCQNLVDKIKHNQYLNSKTIKVFNNAFEDLNYSMNHINNLYA